MWFSDVSRVCVMTQMVRSVEVQDVAALAAVVAFAATVVIWMGHMSMVAG